MTLNDVIAAYLKLRTAKEELVKKHKEELAPLNEAMLKCQLWVHQQLQSQGQQNTRTEAGSAFLQTDTSVTVESWDDTIAWIKENDAWDFLEKRVSKSVVQDYLEAANAIPPGVKVTSDISCHIRK